MRSPYLRFDRGLLEFDHAASQRLFRIGRRLALALERCARLLLLGARRADDAALCLQPLLQVLDDLLVPGQALVRVRLVGEQRGHATRLGVVALALLGDQRARLAFGGDDLGVLGALLLDSAIGARETLGRGLELRLELGRGLGEEVKERCERGTSEFGECGGT